MPTDLTGSTGTHKLREPTDSANPQGAGQPDSDELARAGLARFWPAQDVAGSGWRGSAQAGRAGRSENIGGNLEEHLSDNLL